MNLICWLVGHKWEPRRFQLSPDPATWIHQCARCGAAEIIP